MHQIRVHANEVGQGVAGDRKYGFRDAQKPIREAGLKRLFLHARSLQLPAQDGYPTLRVEAPLPAELEAVLERLPS